MIAARTSDPTIPIRTATRGVTTFTSEDDDKRGADNRSLSHQAKSQRIDGRKSRCPAAAHVSCNAKTDRRSQKHVSVCADIFS